MTKNSLRNAVAAAFAAAAAVSTPAFAVYEVEPNDSLSTAQRLAISSTGTAEVTATMGVTSPSQAATNDVDFYTFEATAAKPGEKAKTLTIDIDGGMKDGTSTRSVDTTIAVWGPGINGPRTLLRMNLDGGQKDAGSGATNHGDWDALISNLAIQTSGTYYVGVSSFKRNFNADGTLTVLAGALNNINANGSYTLLISGATPSVQHITIAIKPYAERASSPINPRSHGKIPVALLSSDTFDAMLVERSTLKFGAKGNEASLEHCGNEGEDVNSDGKLDLVCHFDNQTAGFEPGDTEGVVTGRWTKGQFEGAGFIYIVPGGDKK